VVTTQDFISTVACGYYKIDGGLIYSDWDARR